MLRIWSLISRNRGREECGTVVTDDDIATMEKDVAAVNFKRQTGGIRNYTFGIYLNVVAANMTTDGGWVPYVAFGVFFRSFSWLRQRL